MSFLKAALDLAAKGFHVFPLIPGGKTPLIDDFPTRATTDEATIRDWWTDPVMGIEQPFNVGISTSKYRDGALLVVDVDNKGDKHGDEEIIKLELEGFELPPTFEQHTPTGGKHFAYVVPSPVGQGVDVLGRGVDIRSRGGYVVGAGSVVEAGEYKSVERPLAPAPEWLVSKCGPGNSEPRRERIQDGDSPSIASATARAIHYLENEAPLAVEGAAGDQTTFQVAAKVKDFGVTAEGCFELMYLHWNNRCSPPWSSGELMRKVENAYSYGRDPVGIAAPENDFDVIKTPEAEVHPVIELNKEYAFIVAGGGSHILWETTDHKGLPVVEHLDLDTFHRKLAWKKMYMGDKTAPLSKVWMHSPDRRSYDGFCFVPAGKVPARFYNLWKGFAVEPLSPTEKPSREAQKSLDMFVEHAMVNVCHNDKTLFQWLMGYFAHLVQKPQEKPLVALVFKGLKGTGKNALIERVGHLLGNHFLLTANRRYLVGNFNGHLENLLLFALDEAFWSGDKQAEGTLKDLITGTRHVIEHKGKESYAVENCTRVVIIGNEDWLVPATQDERRFAVFNVGEARRQDRTFFQAMREGMERGGYRLLLRYLLDFDISKVDINQAPATQGLLDQKLASLDPFYQWWADCLDAGRIACGDFGDGWETNPDKERLRQAFFRYCRDHRISGWQPNAVKFGKLLKRCLPQLNAGQRRDGAEILGVYVLPRLDECRQEWARYLGHELEWENG